MPFRVSRRSSFFLGGLGLLAIRNGLAQPVGQASPWVRHKHYVKDSERNGMEAFERIHEGKGSTNLKYFEFDGAAAPANFLIYDFPPGSSEGVHVHRLGDKQLGSYDEYYYIVSGTGQMEIDGEVIQVAAGDHVFTPLDVHHGIENTSATDPLKVLLTFIDR